MKDIKAYSITELAKKDNITRPTVYTLLEKGERYIAVKFETWRAKKDCKLWKQSNPYSIRYIRLEDVKELLNKKYWKMNFTPNKYDRRKKETEKKLYKWNDSKWQKLK